MLLASDQERVALVTEIMDELGFRLKQRHPSHRRGRLFTDSITYDDDQSGDWVQVYFPNEKESERGTSITTQAIFKNRVESPRWTSMKEFEENVGTWIERCRSAD